MRFVSAELQAAMKAHPPRLKARIIILLTKTELIPQFMEQILYPVSDSVSYMQNISKMQKYAKQQYAEITMSNMLNMEPFFDMNNIVQYANNTTDMPKGPNIPNMFTGTTNYFTNMQTIWTPFI